MARNPPQNLGNHARYVPLFHFVLAALLAANFFRALFGLRHFSMDALYAFVVALSLILLWFYVRAFALRVQDRVIRLEMRLRMQQLAPELAGRFDRLELGKVVALRFAGDGELAALAREVLEGKLSAPLEIKRRITEWKADHLRV